MTDLHSVSVTPEGLRTGAQDLGDHILSICARIREREPVLMALLPEEGREDRLLREAIELESRFPVPAKRPPLYGVLLGVKDIFHANGFVTRAGTGLPSGLFASTEEAGCVSALKAAGALILGKTVTTEFAYFEPGPTRNPVNPAHTPGGSSSGSAAAVSAAYCPLALGTQTVGSVIRPAAFCGIVGFKPSYDRIDSSGLIYCAPSVDTVGLFTPDVALMRVAAAVVCANWRELAAEAELPKLCVPDGPYMAQASDQAQEAFEGQVGRLEGAGYAVERIDVLADIDEINTRHRLMQAAETADVHREWFSDHEAAYRPRTAELIREGLAVNGEELEKAREGRLELRERLGEVMSRTRADVWICPSATGPAQEGLSSTGDPAMNLPWTHAGLPALSLPAGRASNGLPLGIQCVAGFNRDEELLGWGSGMEEVLK